MALTSSPRCCSRPRRESVRHARGGGGTCSALHREGRWHRHRPQGEAADGLLQSTSGVRPRPGRLRPRYPGPVHVHAERGGSELAKFSESCLSLFWLSLNCGGGNICETCSTAASKAPRRSESGGGDGGHLPPAPSLCAPPPRTPPAGHPGTALVTRGLAYLLLGAPSPWKAAAVGALALPYWRGHGHWPLPSAGTTEIWGHWLRNAHGSINR